MIGIRHRLIHPKLPAAPSAIRVLVDIDQAERCRREHADLQRPDPVRDQLRERLLQADRRIEEQAEEIGALRDRVTELAGLHLQATAREDELRARIEEMERAALQAAMEREEEVARTLLSLEQAAPQDTAREAALITRIEELETQIVSAERRVKGAEAEAATLRKLKGGAAPADNFNRRPPDNGRRML